MASAERQRCIVKFKRKNGVDDILEGTYDQDTVTFFVDGVPWGVDNANWPYKRATIITRHGFLGHKATPFPTFRVHEDFPAFDLPDDFLEARFVEHLRDVLEKARKESGGNDPEKLAIAVEQILVDEKHLEQVTAQHIADSLALNPKPATYAEAVLNEREQALYRLQKETWFETIAFSLYALFVGWSYSSLGILPDIWTEKWGFAVMILSLLLIMVVWGKKKR